MTKFNAAFWRWFGDSKVVDANGEPLVVYHGTDADFTVFESGHDTCDLRRRSGFYFSVKQSYAKQYTGDDGKVLPCYLSIRNPVDVREGWPEHVAEKLDYVVDFQWLTTFPASDFWNALDGDLGFNVLEALKVLGYDGLHATEVGHEVWVAFSPTQIKSINNAGTWSPTDPDIRRNPSYKEIEFVCVNREFPGATPPAKQRALLRALTGVAGVFPYRQDWGEGQVSLAVIIVDPKAETEVRRLAKTIGVEIDIDETFRTEKFLDAAIDGEMEGQI